MGHTPYGYRIESGRAVIDEEEAERLRKLYDGYLAGLSLKEAADKAGINVYHAQVKRMLLNKKYAGTSFYPPIIDTKVIELVAKEADRRAIKLGRIYEPKIKEHTEPPMRFAYGSTDKKYKDPYRQAQYIYEHIKEADLDG